MEKIRSKILKRCCYKDCASVFTNLDTNPTETFFQFPKDPIRCNVWVKRSQCDTNITTKYLCSKHFDPTKYIANNPRRKLLLGTAVPYAYVDPTPELDSGEDELHDDNQSDEIERIDEECQNVESTINDGASEFAVEALDEPIDEIDERSSVELIPADQAGGYIMCDVKFEAEYIKKSKRKAESSTDGEAVSKLKHQKLASENIVASSTGRSFGKKETKQEPEDSVVEEEINDDDILPTGPDVSTFIFKGQEYIQMPKNDYIQNNLALHRQLNHLKSVINAIKLNLDNIDI